MSDSTPMFVIVVDRATDEELTKAHSRIKSRAKGWWHHYANVWIAGGLTATEWRDLLVDALSSPPSSVLVFKLPGSHAGWAYYGPDHKKRNEWLHNNLKPPDE